MKPKMVNQQKIHGNHRESTLAVGGKQFLTTKISNVLMKMVNKVNV